MNATSIVSHADAARPARPHPRSTAARLRRTCALAFAGIAMSLCTALRAQPADDFAAPPVPGAPRPLRIATPTEQRLPNGLRVVLAQRPGVQLVTAQLLVLSGSAIDPPARAGLASMTASLLTKGTRRHNAPALAQAAESLGGSLDGGAGPDRSELGITVSVPQLGAALDLLSEAVREPLFAQAEIDRLRSQTLDGLKVAYAQPGTLATLAAQHLQFGNGAYGRPNDGTPASLARITRADLRALHAAAYRPDNAVLIFAGDLDDATALQLAQRHFGSWRAAAGAQRSLPTASVGAGLPQRAALIDLPQAGQAAVVVSSTMPPLGEGRAAAAVLNEVLGGNFSSRLGQEIRIKRGLSYGAGSQIDARREAATMRVIVQTQNASATEVVGLVQHELDRLIAAPVEAAELDARKAALIGGFSRAVETTAGLGAGVASLIVAGLPVAELGRRIDALAAVQAGDLQALAAVLLAPERRRVVVAGDGAKIADALTAALPGLQRVPAAALALERSDGLTAP
jgi:zinc protease